MFSSFRAFGHCLLGIPLELLIEVELVDEHHERGEVEEEADIKHSHRLLNESQELEVTVLVWTLIRHRVQHAINRLIGINSNTAFHAAITATVATIAASGIVHRRQGCTDAASSGSAGIDTTRSQIRVVS